MVLTKRQERIKAELPEKVRKYLELKAQMEELKKEMEELKDEILVNMDRLQTDKIEIEELNVKVSKVEFTSVYIDRKKLQAEYPEIFEQVKQEKQILRLDIRKVKKGSRKTGLTVPQPVVNATT